MMILVAVTSPSVMVNVFSLTATAQRLRVTRFASQPQPPQEAVASSNQDSSLLTFKTFHACPARELKPVPPFATAKIPVTSLARLVKLRSCWASFGFVAHIVKEAMK
jgi:hypothetical protein